MLVLLFSVHHTFCLQYDLSKKSASFDPGLSNYLMDRGQSEQQTNEQENSGNCTSYAESTQSVDG